jgi:hypothetical protein
VKYLFIPKPFKQNSDYFNLFNSSNAASVFHDPDFLFQYMSMKGLKDHSILIYEPSGRLVGACPLVLKAYNGTRIMESPDQSGLIISDNVSSKVLREILSELSDYLKNLISTESVDEIIISSSNIAPRLVDQHIPETVILQGFQIKCTGYYYINLEKEEDVLKKSLETRVRTIINRYYKEDFLGYNFFKLTSSNFDSLVNLYKQTHERTGLPEKHNNEIMMYLNSPRFDFYGALKNEHLCAVIGIASYKKSAIYAFSYVHNDAIKDDIQTFLLWHSIMMSKKKNIKHFDCGNYDWNAEVDSKSASIARFKRGFGGELRLKFKAHFTSKKLKAKQLSKDLIKLILK